MDNYKQKSLNFQGFDESKILRALKISDRRKASRSDLFFSRRNIKETDSLDDTGTPSLLKKKGTSNCNDAKPIANDRHQQLMKWKEQRDLKKKVMKEKRRPVFKVGSVTRDKTPRMSSRPCASRINLSQIQTHKSVKPQQKENLPQRRAHRPVKAQQKENVRPVIQETRRVTRSMAKKPEVKTATKTVVTRHCSQSKVNMHKKVKNIATKKSSVDATKPKSMYGKTVQLKSNAEAKKKIDVPNSIREADQDEMNKWFEDKEWNNTIPNSPEITSKSFAPKNFIFQAPGNLANVTWEPTPLTPRSSTHFIFPAAKSSSENLPTVIGRGSSTPVHDLKERIDEQIVLSENGLPIPKISFEDEGQDEAVTFETRSNLKRTPSSKLSNDAVKASPANEDVGTPIPFKLDANEQDGINVNTEKSPVDARVNDCDAKVTEFASSCLDNSMCDKNDSLCSATTALPEKYLHRTIVVTPECKSNKKTPRSVAKLIAVETPVRRSVRLMQKLVIDSPATIVKDSAKLKLLGIERMSRHFHSNDSRASLLYSPSTPKISIIGNETTDLMCFDSA